MVVSVRNVSVLIFDGLVGLALLFWYEESVVEFMILSDMLLPSPLPLLLPQLARTTAMIIVDIPIAFFIKFKFCVANQFHCSRIFMKNAFLLHFMKS